MNARDIDELLGTPARLAIVATLARVPSLAFTDLGRETGLADGNLHVQTRKLTAAGYVQGEKGKRGNRQVTCFALTDLGREKFRNHIQTLAAAGGMTAPFGGRSGAGSYTSVRKNKDDSQVW